MTSRETICILLESCKEKTGRRGRKLTKGIMAENISIVGRHLDIHVHEAPGSPKRFNQKI